MKKNYVKPTLLSETFVTEDIMTDVTKNVLSKGIDLYLNGHKFEGITFSDSNTLSTISVNDFNL